jgi:hypothetical protein
MTSSHDPLNDPYREWDAAYLLGSLSPTERREYEEHLKTCPHCPAELSSLVGLTGILSTVPPERAMALLTEDPATIEPAAPNLLPRLVDATRRARRRARIAVAALAGAAAVAAAAIAVVVVPRDEPAAPAAAGQTVQLVPMKQPSRLSAEVRLVAKPWGTWIDAVCRYDHPDDPAATTGPVKTFDYAMYVTDRDGKTSQISNWYSSSEDSEVRPSGTTKLEVDEIASIDIRSVRTGAVLLRAQL